MSTQKWIGGKVLNWFKMGLILFLFCFVNSRKVFNYKRRWAAKPLLLSLAFPGQTSSSTRRLLNTSASVAAVLETWYYVRLVRGPPQLASSPTSWSVTQGGWCMRQVLAFFFLGLSLYAFILWWFIFKKPLLWAAKNNFYCTLLDILWQSLINTLSSSTSKLPLWLWKHKDNLYFSSALTKRSLSGQRCHLARSSVL